MILAGEQRETPALPSFPVARDLLLGSLDVLPSERIPLESALGRTLRGPIYADADLVPYPRSAMDGFAVRSDDVARIPITLPIVKCVYAKRGDDVHAPKSATAIATGAPLPHGSDAVIAVEDLQVSATTITIFEPVECGDNVFPAGQDARRGDVLVPDGRRLAAGTLGLLAAVGHDVVEVTRKPRVAIVCTGDEIVPTQMSPARGEVRNSNGIMLASLVAESGAEVVKQMIVSDDCDRLASTFAAVLSNADALVVTGGASLGPRDFVKAALARLNARWFFTAVAIRPGRPTATAIVHGKPVFVLPGNPAAAFVAASVFLQPALRRMAGQRPQTASTSRVRLGVEIRAKPGRHCFVFARFVYGDALSVVPLGNQCSSLTRTAADADALIVVDPEQGLLQAGDMATILPLRPSTSG